MLKASSNQQRWAEQACFFGREQWQVRVAPVSRLGAWKTWLGVQSDSLSERTTRLIYV